MDEKHLLAAARYIELNPVKAKLVSRPENYQWSSALAHRTEKDDKLVRVAPLLAIISNWKDFLAEPVSQEQEKTILKHEQTGRPLGGRFYIHVGGYARQNFKEGEARA